MCARTDSTDLTLSEMLVHCSADGDTKGLGIFEAMPMLCGVSQMASQSHTVCVASRYSIWDTIVERANLLPGTIPVIQSQ